MTDRKLMQQALDALEEYTNVVTSVNDPNSWVTVADGGRPAREAITALNERLAQPEQEPISMRLPKAGDKVICLEDDSLATVVSLTAGGSPDIVFSDGSRGTYLLREFAELFGYAAPSPQRKPLTDEEVVEVLGNVRESITGNVFLAFARAIEAKLKERNT